MGTRRRKTPFGARRTGLRWVLYVRISFNRSRQILAAAKAAGKDVSGAEPEMESIDNQIEALTRWIEHRDPDGEIVDIYIDDAIPASGRMTKGNQRPAFDRLRADATLGVYDAAAAVHTDRYTRRLRELEDLCDLHDEHGVLFCAMTGDIDLSTAAGRAFARNLGVWSAYEGELKTERMEMRYEADARKGKVHKGGVRCYGYNKEDTALIPHEVDVIREMAKRIVFDSPRESIRSVCRDLRDRDVRTVSGSHFAPTSVVRLITNPRLRGARAYHGEIVAEDVYPRIFTDAEYALIEAFFEDPERPTLTKPKRKYVLSGGLSKCGLCGSSLTGQPSNSKKRGYVCNTNVPTEGCGRIRIQAEALEDFVAAQVLARFASPTVRRRVQAAASTADGDASIVEELALVERRLSELGVEKAKGEIDKTAFASAQNYLTGERKRLHERMREGRRVAALPIGLPTTVEELADWWTKPETTVEEKRDLLSTVVDHVSIGSVIKRGNTRFEEERVTIVWK